MHYDRRTLEILLGTIAIPIADEVIDLLELPDRVLPPARSLLDAVLGSTAVEKWKQSKKNIYETDAIEVLESGRVDATEERWKRLKCGLARLEKEIDDAIERINPIDHHEEDGRVVRKHDKGIERVKAFIRPDETLEEALDRLTEKLRDETELQPAAQVDPELEKKKREMRLAVEFLETAISGGKRRRDLDHLEQRVLRIQTMIDYWLEVLLSKKALWDIPGERIRDKRPVNVEASEDPAPAAGPDAGPAGEETPEKTPEAFVEDKTTKSLPALSPDHRARLDTLMEAMCVLLDDIEAGRVDVSEIASDLSGIPQQSSELFMLLVKRAPTAKKHDQQTSDSLRSVLRRLLGSDYWPLGRGKTFNIKSWYTLRDEWRAGEVR